jgi:hypothetical protein
MGSAAGAVLVVPQLALILVELVLVAPNLAGLLALELAGPRRGAVLAGLRLPRLAALQLLQIALVVPQLALVLMQLAPILTDVVGSGGLESGRSHQQGRQRTHHHKSTHLAPHSVADDSAVLVRK